MTKKQQNKVVPKLRFPEFKQEWKFEKGDILFNQISNKKHDSQLPILAITQDNGAIPRDRINYNVVVTDKSVESYKVVEIGDFIISLRSFQGGIEYSKYNGICSPAYIILRKKIEVEDAFYLHYFKTTHFITQLNRNIEGIRDGKMVSYDQFSNLLLPNPSSKEQQKIADCLSSLDDLINSEKEKLDALKAHKKGLMQQMFPAAGDIVPKLRFKEFRNSGEWVEKTLDELGDNITGLTYGPDDVRDNGLLVLRSSNIQNGKILLDDCVYVRADIKGAHLTKPGDILICVRNGSKALIGKSALIPIEMPLSTHGAFMTIFRAFKPEFVYQLFQTERYSNQVSNDLGATINSINGKNFLKYTFYVPGPDEQQKIAEALSSLDEQIDSQTQRVETLKLQKKGLMQQLFPEINNNHGQS